MAIITLGLGGIGVMNIMLVCVAERTREIGVKQAVGATRNRILFEFFLEAVSSDHFQRAGGPGGGAGHLPPRGPPSVADVVFRAAGAPGTACLAFGTLVIVGILSAIYPGPPRLSAHPGRSPAVRMIRHIFKEALGALGHYRMRSALTMLSIIWGVVSLMLLLAYGQGFERAMTKAFLQIGKDLVVVFPGQTSMQAGGERSGRKILLELSDVNAIQEGVPTVEAVSPEVRRHLTST